MRHESSIIICILTLLIFILLFAKLSIVVACQYQYVGTLDRCGCNRTGRRFGSSDPSGRNDFRFGILQPRLTVHVMKLLSGAEGT